MSKVRQDEIHHWLREAEQERSVPTPLSPAPAQQQHPQQPTRIEDDEDGSPD